MTYSQHPPDQPSSYRDTNIPTSAAMALKTPSRSTSPVRGSAPPNMQPASSASTTATTITQQQEPGIDQLILDAGPLLAQLPLRNMAKKFYVSPTVMAELKDKKARDYLKFLTIAGMDLEVREAGPEALAKVIAFAKQTGDYAVLSRPDLAVLALAYALEVERHGIWRIRDELGGKTGQQRHEAQRLTRASADSSANTGPAETSADKLGQSTAPQQPDQAANAELVSDATTAGIQGADEPEDANAGATVDEEGESLQDVSVYDDERVDGEQEDEDATTQAMASIDLKARFGPGTKSSAGKALSDFGQHEKAHAEGVGADFHVDDDNNEDVGWTQVASSSRRQQREEQDYGGSDGEGEWITGETITKQKQKDLGLVTDEALTAMRGGLGATNAAKEGTAPAAAPFRGEKGSTGKKGAGRMTVATMTADYAVQNVLLQMGLALVSTKGYRIERVKSWVLRCHACFKICKDSDKKFCPSCGNPTLLRTSVTSVPPGLKSTANTWGGLQIHLRQNFQYRTRGNVYSLPLPKPSSSSALKDPRKHAVPILREDQAEWQRGLAKERVRRNKEQKALDRALEKGKDTLSARYEDPDWIPGLLIGDSSKKGWEGLPVIGSGRRNPNQARHGRRRK